MPRNTEKGVRRPDLMNRGGSSKTQPPYVFAEAEVPWDKEQPPAGAGTSAPREQVRVTVGPGGRVVIPAPYRDALGIREGTAVFMQLDGDELRVVSDRTEVRRVRKLLARHLPKGVSVVDQLILERRREAAQEDGA